MDTKCFLNNK